MSAAALTITAEWLRHFTPPRKLSASEWAEANVVLPRSTNAKPGAVKLSRYQAGMIDRVSRPGTRVAVFMLAAQTGKSIAIDALLLNRIKCDPGPTLHLSPDDAKAKSFVKERLDPLVAESPNLCGMFGTGRRGGDGDSLSFKDFPGGYLATGSSYKAGDLASRSLRYIFLDEVDRFALSAGQEGDPVLIAMKRLHTFRGKSLAVLASTPTDSTSRIAAWHARGDQAQFFVPCPDCLDFAPLAWSRLKYRSGEPETAYLSCEVCGHHITERERRAAIAHGEWRATAKGEPGVLSFHGNVLLSEFTTLADIAQEEESSAESPEGARVFTNTSRAEVYEPEGVEADPNALQSRAVEIVAPYPAEIEFVTIGADVQGDRIEATVLGHGKGNQVAVLQHHVMPGDVTGDAAFKALDRLMGATFRTRDGRSLPVACTAVDSGYQADRVYEFTAGQRFKGRQIKPIKGVSGFGRPRLDRGRREPKFGQTIHLVGVDSLKENIMLRLNMKSDGPSYIWLPDHLDIEYFEGLASESLSSVYVRGTLRKKWRKTQKRNESLDCLCYAIAVADTVDRKRLRSKAEKPVDLSLNNVHQLRG